MKQAQIKIEYLALDKLTPYEKNARKHQEADLKTIEASIEQFGMCDPIGIWSDKNIIVEGHGRLLALKKLGYTEAPCIRLDHLNDEERRAYALAHNKTAEMSEWEFDKLEAELAELANMELDFSMQDFGFEAFEIEEEKEIIEDEAPEVDEEAEPICKLGDIWQLGEHRLMCGDSTDKATVERLMNGNKADLVFTDPPYGMKLDTDFSSMKSKLFKGKTGGAEYSEVIGDNADFKPELINTIFDNFGYCKEIFTWGADYYAELLPNKNAGSWIVWDKRLDDSADKMYGSCFELCWSKNKHKRDIARVKWAGIFGMENQDTKTRVHPTQKPINLVSWFLTKYSNENDLVVDIYGGSGSMLIAREQLGRKCYTMELDPKYCDVIIKRWETLTGEKAVRL